jgi:plastocyanin
MNPYTRDMAPRYPGYLPAHQSTPVAAAPRAAALASAETTPVNSGVQADGDSASAAENITVRISGMRFEPSNITVKPGTTVIWVQGSNMPHTVTGQADELRSGTLTGGQQFSHTFDATGRFDYRCDFHPSMKGNVIVEGMDT